jgi:prevent-host-death family protein
MPGKVSTKDIRRRIGDLLNRVALRHDEFNVERKGQPLAALVPAERLEQMRRFARRHALEALERQAGGPLSDERAMALAVQAERWAREHTKGRRSGTK